MNRFMGLAFSWPFILSGLFVIFNSRKGCLNKKTEGIATAKRARKAKEELEDATEDELIYEYTVDGELYKIVVTPGDTVKDFIGIAYKLDDPEDSRIYEDSGISGTLSMIAFGSIFVVVGIIMLVIVSHG